MRFKATWLPLSAIVLCTPVFGQSTSVEDSARAILNAKCAVCHGEARMSGLDVRDRSTILKGGTRGPAVVPGKSAESLLFKAVKRDGDLQMPPGKVPLPGADVEVIRQWIDGGARWSSNVKPAQQSSWWSFKKPVRPPVPAVTNKAWVQNPIDAFILSKLEKEGLRPSPPADRATLIRRASFDLLGLPPTSKEVEDFVQDSSGQAYAKLVDRLLSSPRYGERWGRYWLDLVRYADTSGFETDHFFPNAWRYRDYVIDSFNNDKPYTTFVQEQIAADEIWPDNMELEGTSHLSKSKEENVRRRIGTSLFTLGSFPIEFTYYGDQYRAEWQADAVDTTGAAFLGLTIGCARCHDHKFDPIRQRDYYSLTAFFAGSEEREIPLVSQFDILTYTRSTPLISQVDALKQLARGRGRGAVGTTADAAAIPAPAPSADRAAAMQKIGELYTRLPNHFPTAHVLAHQETIPETHILFRGDFKTKGEKVEPAFPPVLNPGPALNEPKDILFVPQRRKALALWLTAPDQPLVARVMVNRIWQGHFGQGIVRTPNDFGRQGDAPTHPELLDWLAVEFADRGWSVKQMHRMIMLSNAYQTSAIADPVSLERDPENYLLSHMNRRRLDSDSIRDTILDAAGTLNLKMGGMGIIPALSKEEIQAARMPDLWPPNPDPAEYNRRTIYLQMKRSLTLPMLQTFDAPDTATSCPRRDASTVAPQALTLMNGDFTLAQADKFAARLKKESGENPEALVENGWHIAFGRSPSADERKMALDYLQRNSLPRLCLLIFNMSEFIYVD
jgi:Protein of unknown function (DUF1553)/Protein of unknown function (DUF1549)/Planctomycete cytochrome C